MEFSGQDKIIGSHTFIAFCSHASSPLRYVCSSASPPGTQLHVPKALNRCMLARPLVVYIVLLKMFL